jgi:hypothetical protein
MMRESQRDRREVRYWNPRKKFQKESGLSWDIQASKEETAEHDVGKR